MESSREISRRVLIGTAVLGGAEIAAGGLSSLFPPTYSFEVIPGKVRCLKNGVPIWELEAARFGALAKVRLTNDAANGRATIELVNAEWPGTELEARLRIDARNLPGEPKLKITLSGLLSAPLTGGIESWKAGFVGSLTSTKHSVLFEKETGVPGGGVDVWLAGGTKVRVLDSLTLHFEASDSLKGQLDGQPIVGAVAIEAKRAADGKPESRISIDCSANPFTSKIAQPPPTSGVSFAKPPPNLTPRFRLVTLITRSDRFGAVLAAPSQGNVGMFLPKGKYLDHSRLLQIHVESSEFEWKPNKVVSRTLVGRLAPAPSDGWDDDGDKSPLLVRGTAQAVETPEARVYLADGGPLSFSFDYEASSWKARGKVRLVGLRYGLNGAVSRAVVADSLLDVAGGANSALDLTKGTLVLTSRERNYRLVRGRNALDLKIRLRNFTYGTPGKALARAGASIELIFPAQSLGETALFEDSSGLHPQDAAQLDVDHRLAGAVDRARTTRLAYLIPENELLTLTHSALLDRCERAELLLPTIGADEGTVMWAPWRMALGPTGTNRFDLKGLESESEGMIAHAWLWPAGAGWRVVGSDPINLPLIDEKDEASPVRRRTLPLRAKVRKDLLTVANSGGLKVDTLSLSSQGATLALSGEWTNGNPDRWIHRSAQGRAQYDYYSYRGTLFPWGIACRLVTVTDRVVRRVKPDAIVKKPGQPERKYPVFVAFLRQQDFIEIPAQSRVADFNDVPLTDRSPASVARRSFPMRKVAIAAPSQVADVVAGKSLEDPYRTPPLDFEPYDRIPSGTSVQGRLKRWIRVGRQHHRFPAAIVDASGSGHDSNIAAIFVESGSKPEDLLQCEQYWKSDPSATFVPLQGQRLALVPRLPQGNDSPDPARAAYSASVLSTLVKVPVSSQPYAVSDFHPQFETIQIALPEVAQVSGSYPTFERVRDLFTNGALRLIDAGDQAHGQLSTIGGDAASVAQLTTGILRRLSAAKSEILSWTIRDLVSKGLPGPYADLLSLQAAVSEPKRPLADEFEKIRSFLNTNAGTRDQKIAYLTSAFPLAFDGGLKEIDRLRAKVESAVEVAERLNGLAVGGVARVKAGTADPATWLSAEYRKRLALVGSLPSAPPQLTLLLARTVAVLDRLSQGSTTVGASAANARMDLEGAISQLDQSVTVVQALIDATTGLQTPGSVEAMKSAAALGRAVSKAGREVSDALRALGLDFVGISTTLQGASAALIALPPALRAKVQDKWNSALQRLSTAGQKPVNQFAIELSDLRGDLLPGLYLVELAASTLSSSVVSASAELTKHLDLASETLLDAREKSLVAIEFVQDLFPQSDKGLQEAVNDVDRAAQEVSEELRLLAERGRRQLDRVLDTKLLDLLDVPAGFTASSIEDLESALKSLESAESEMARLVTQTARLSDRVLKELLNEASVLRDAARKWLNKHEEAIQREAERLRREAEKAAAEGARQAEIALGQVWKDVGFDLDLNRGEVFAELAEGVGALVDAAKGAGIAVPDFPIKGLSRVAGLVNSVSGDLTQFARGKIDPRDFLRGDLFGLVPLADVLSLIEDARGAYKWVKDQNQQRLRLETGRVQNFGPIRWGSRDGSKNGRFTFDSTITIVPPSQTTKVALDWVGLDIAGLILIVFERVEIVFDATGVHHNVVVSDVYFNGDLSFFNDIQEAIGDLLGGLRLSIEEGSLRIGKSVSLPTISMGAFSLSNLRFDVAVFLSLSNKPLRVRLALGTRYEPFTVRVLLVAGGGYFAVTASPDPRELAVEIALEAGGRLDFDIGVASGAVYAMVGVYMRLQAGRWAIGGYVRIGGHVRVLGLITVTVCFLLQLRYESNGTLYGSAEMHVEIEFLFFSIEVKLFVERRLAGNGGSSLDSVQCDALPQAGFGFKKAFANPTAFAEYWNSFE